MQTASTVIPSSAMLEPASTGIRPSTFAASPPPVEIPSPKSSATPSTSISATNGIEAPTTTALVEWFQHHVYADAMRNLLARWRHVSMLDAEQAWQDFCMFVYRQALTGDRFDTLSAARSFAIGMHTKLYRFVVLDERQARSSNGGEGPIASRYFSELEDEQITRTIEAASRRRDRSPPPEMSPSVGWLSDALERMQDHHREAVTRFHVAGESRNDIAESMNCTPRQVGKFVYNARAAIRTAAKKAGYPQKLVG